MTVFDPPDARPAKQTTPGYPTPSVPTYTASTQEAWPARRLLPLLAGLVEIEPWLHQWHNDKRDEYLGGSPAAFFTNFINTELAQLSADRSALALLRGVPDLP